MSIAISSGVAIGRICLQGKLFLRKAMDKVELFLKLFPKSILMQIASGRRKQPYAPNDLGDADVMMDYFSLFKLNYLQLLTF